MRAASFSLLTELTLIMFNILLPNFNQLLPVTIACFGEAKQWYGDPDQLASQKPADLDLHCLQNRIYRALTC